MTVARHQAVGSAQGGRSITCSLATLLNIDCAACRALAGAAPVHRAAGFDAASPATAIGPGILNTMVGLTRVRITADQHGITGPRQDYYASISRIE